MELTAIKVHGKKKRDCGKAAVADRKLLKRPSGRPFKLSDQNEETHVSAISEPPSKKSKKRTMKNLKSRRKMSDLEKLPTEILETVFLFCLNLDLPKASPIIAAKLSSQIVYNKTILTAFGPTWERWHGRERNWLQKRNTQPGDFEEDPALQSAVLRCRWATLPIIMDAKDNWIQRFAKDRPFKPAWFDIKSNAPPEDFEEHDTPQDPTEEHDEPQMTAQEYLDADFKGFSDLILSERDGGWLWDECSWDRNSDVTEGIEMPQSLLSGPWDEDMLKYLFWLRKSGAGIDWLSSTSGEVGLEGMKKAILFGDIRAIHLLAWTGIIEKLDVDLLIWAFRNAGGDKLAVINQLLRLNFSTIPDRVSRKLDKELADLMEEARQDGDDEKHELVMRILTSETLDGRLEAVG
ncbi:uncharacterized protein PAC_01420 [Phialocephala subalpina]|uniref:Uncharacterized protein n=1 Tax=Phialocephala subalpina TaxID=576137 RepID=A0A1L7WFJ1_9HELO|nr:uncharacterized protein PAC_01420 [Phialocephala subalpina]